MAIRPDYLVRETGQNLIRNWLLSTATVLIVTVSLTMLGITVLVGYFGLDNAFVRWNNDVSFIVYMDSTATQPQIDAIGAELKASKLVDTVEYYDTNKTWDLFVKIFKQTNPEMVSSTKREDLPTSFRVKPSNPDASVVREMAASYRPKTGVYDVDFPAEQVRTVQRAAERIRLWLLVGVIALLIASVVLIFIAIQTAVFSRRREIEVMRLVGATNWFIRIPFLVEGVIQGLVGGLLAAGFTWVLGTAWKSAGASMKNSLLAQFLWQPGQALLTYGALIAIGSFVGAVGSALSVSWYLRV